MVRRFPEEEGSEIVCRLLDGDGPSGRLRARFPDREDAIAHVLMVGIAESPNLDYYPFMIVFETWGCEVCGAVLATVWWICPLCNRGG